MLSIRSEFLPVEWVSAEAKTAGLAFYFLCPFLWGNNVGRC